MGPLRPAVVGSSATLLALAERLATTTSRIGSHSQAHPGVVEPALRDVAGAGGLAAVQHQAQLVRTERSAMTFLAADDALLFGAGEENFVMLEAACTDPPMTLRTSVFEKTRIKTALDNPRIHTPGLYSKEGYKTKRSDEWTSLIWCETRSESFP